MLREAALTMQQGGGIGYDFSTIRPKTSLVKKLGADASGPLSFMDCWDSMCRTVMSAGSRRGAMMATMHCTHPDIGDFIEAKRDAAKLRMFNLSVLASDPFMQAVEEDADWPLYHKEPAIGQTLMDQVEIDGESVYIHRTVKARDLWDQIMQATYDVAEPGVIFIDRINKMNNLNYCETIRATNPCGEQPLPPYGACLLGSINMAKFILNPFEQYAEIDYDGLCTTIRMAVRMMDNVVDVSNFPLEAQREEAVAKRRIGLGMTGLADALIMLGETYGAEEAAVVAEAMAEYVAKIAYIASVDLAKEKGAFPLFDADKFLNNGSFAATKMDESIKADIREHGIRNALLTSIAPTGTISLYAGNVSSGIEPVFAFSYKRKVLQPDGSRTEEIVQDYAVAAYRDYLIESGLDDEEMQAVMAGDFDLPSTFVTAQTLLPEHHVRMQAAVQKWVDSSISKTVNLPEDISFEDFKAVYRSAYDQDCKGCTTYRPNDVTGSVLSVEEKPKGEAKWADTAAFLVEVQNIHDRNVAEMGQDARTHYFDVLDVFGVDMVADVPVERRVDFIDYMQSTEPVVEGVDFGPEAEDHDDLSDLEDDEMLVRARGYAMSEEEEAANTASLARGFMPANEDLPERPEELDGTTYKIKIGANKAVYLTVNDTVESDGTVRPFEIFLRSSDPAHDEWMVALARTVSAILRRPYDASFLAAELKQVVSASTGGFGHGRYHPSIVAAIGFKLEEHMNRLGEDVAINKAAAMGKSEVATADAILTFSHRGTTRVEKPGQSCPQCHGYNVSVTGGCPTCMDCGWSKCS
jgi:ribonucleoside-diphosphate reductase alpha chain